MQRSRMLCAAAPIACAMVALPLFAQPEQANGPDRRASRAGEVAQNPAQPPQGPMNPTDRIRLHKDSITLPFVIDQPGSYVLTSDLTGVPGEDGLIIAASDVTLDLNGFTLRGVEGSGTGVRVTDQQGRVVDIAITNGAVVGWGGRGVDVGAPMRSARIEHIRAIGNGVGIQASANAIIQGCHAVDNENAGIATGAGSLVVDSIARGNGGAGIAVQERSVIRGCLARENGRDGYVVWSRSLVEDSTSIGNALSGIQAHASVIVRSCVLETNGWHGARMQRDASIEDTRASGNARNGLRVDEAARIERCESTGNGATGVVALDGGVIRNCVVRGNGVGYSGPSAIDGGAVISGNVLATHLDLAPVAGVVLTRLSKCEFVDNTVRSGRVIATDSLVAGNRLYNDAAVVASGPGVAPIVESVADAGPHDNIRLPG